MKTFFIEQANKNSKVKSLLNIVEKRENKIIIYKDLAKCKIENKMKITNKIRNILLNEKSRQIVLSNSLKEDRELVNLLYSNNINICTGKWIFKYFLDEVIDEVLVKKAKKRQESEIHICVNDVDTQIENYIYKLATGFKRINIITNHIGKFKKIETKLYEENGLLITITNNKRKSLLKAELIVNFDFPKELLNQFAIFDNAIIINLDGEMKIRKKRFSGRIINDFKIEIDDREEITNFIKENELENYDVKEICEAMEIVPKCKIFV